GGGAARRAGLGRSGDRGGRLPPVVEGGDEYATQERRLLRRHPHRLVWRSGDPAMADGASVRRLSDVGSVDGPDRATGAHCTGGRGGDLMAVQRVSVPYEHDPADLQTIYLAVTSGTEPQEHEWKPAYRDTRDGRRVVWVKTEVPPRN